jgi:hypothetical protein
MDCERTHGAQHVAQREILREAVVHIHAPDLPEWLIPLKYRSMLPPPRQSLRPELDQLQLRQ